MQKPVNQCLTKNYSLDARMSIFFLDLFVQLVILSELILSIGQGIGEIYAVPVRCDAQDFFSQKQKLHKRVFNFELFFFVLHLSFFV